MTVAENLLRLYRWQFQERQQHLHGLQSLGERLRADAQRLTDEIASASLGAGLTASPGPGSDRLARRLVERKRKLEHSLAEIESRIVEARAAVLAAETEAERQGIVAGQCAETAGLVLRRRPPRSTRATPPIPGLPAWRRR